MVQLLFLHKLDRQYSQKYIPPLSNLVHQLCSYCRVNIRHTDIISFYIIQIFIQILQQPFHIDSRYINAHNIACRYLLLIHFSLIGTSHFYLVSINIFNQTSSILSSLLPAPPSPSSPFPETPVPAQLSVYACRSS